MSRVRIGALARRFRVSPQTIRYYEEQGFLQPAREKDTGIRRYHVRTLKLLSSIRQYHNLGFGTREIRDLFEKTGLAEIDRALADKERQAAREMHSLSMRQEALTRQRQGIARAGALLNRFEVTPLPPLYVLIDRVGDAVLEDEAIWGRLDRWIEALPIVCETVRAAAASVRAFDAYAGRESGYSVWAEDARRLDLPCDPPVRRVEAPMTIHTVLMRSPEVPSYEGVCAFAREKGLRLTDASVQRVLAKVGEFSAAGEEVIPRAVYYECWFPVRPEC